MADKIPILKRKDVEMKALGQQILDFANENYSGKKIPVNKLKKEFNCSRAIVFEAYSYGPAELRQFELVETKRSAPGEKSSRVIASKKGTVTITKIHIDSYNETYSAKPINHGDEFDVTIDEDKFILTRYSDLDRRCLEAFSPIAPPNFQLPYRQAS